MTRKYSPTAVFEAEQSLTLTLAEWQPADDGVEFRAEIRLHLAGNAKARADHLEKERSAAHLASAIEQDRIEFLEGIALRDPTRAQLWWLLRSVETGEATTSWEAFDQFVRPLIHSATRHDDAVKAIAKTLAVLVDRVEGDPRRLTILAQIGAQLFTAMGWPDLAEGALTLLDSSRTEENPSTTSQQQGYGGDTL